ncbi:LamG domain-containing protein [Candidatus Woesearchaeota archaeon]|nr:LamG domain-containing protein [Candidatus Woesearchaeota archaeon]
MNKIILYILMCMLIVSSVLGASKHDFVELVENTDYCFDCYTIYKITKADDTQLTKLGLDFKDDTGKFVLPYYDVSYLVTEDYIDYVDMYEPCMKNKTNVSDETGEEVIVEYEAQCYVGKEEVQKTRSYYVSDYEPSVSLSSIRDAYNDAGVGDSFFVRISGKLKRGESLDNILVLNDFVYDEYAWWNASFPFRYNITNVTSSDLAVSINGTRGFNGSFIWFNPSQSTGIPAVYFNNGDNNYTVANDTGELNYDSEAGGKSRNPESVYSGNASVVWHFEDDGKCKDSTSSGFNGTLDTVDWESDCLFGGCYEWNHTGDVKGSNIRVMESFFNNDVTSVSFWFKPDFSYTADSYYTFYDTWNTDDDEFLFWKQNNANNNELEFNHKEGGANIEVAFYNTSNQPGWWNVSGWTHIVTVWDDPNNRAILYVNGNLDGNKSFNITKSGIEKFYLGCNVNEKWTFGGKIDDLRIYDRELTPAEIYELYNNSKNLNNLFGAVETPPEPVANESSGRAAIIAGVDASEISGSYTAYTDKQLYIRLANGSQYKGTFDKYIAYSSGGTYKRWGFNYDEHNDSGFPTFFNITPVFYFWQNYNMTYNQIKWNVSGYINNTYP